jgi:hypothetical protein
MSVEQDFYKIILDITCLKPDSLAKLLGASLDGHLTLA